MLVLDLGCGQKPLRNATHGIDVLDPKYVHYPIPGFVYLQQELGDRPWPLQEGFEKVYASHILEHFERAEAVLLLQEVYRLLIPGGRFQVRVPNFFKVAQEVAKGNNPEIPAWMPMGSHPPVAWLFGMDLSAQTGTGYPFNKHRWAYTPETLQHLLIEAGFKLKATNRSDEWEISHIYMKPKKPEGDHG